MEAIFIHPLCRADVPLEEVTEQVDHQQQDEEGQQLQSVFPHQENQLYLKGLMRINPELGFWREMAAVLLTGPPIDAIKRLEGVYIKKHPQQNNL